MIPRHPDPKEFVHRPIDLTPLIDAALDAASNDNWTKVEELISNGYSLLWVDSKTKETAIRTLAKKDNARVIIKKLLDLSQKENGDLSGAHKFITIEATIGGLHNQNRCPINEIADRSHPLQYYRVFHPLAEMGGDLVGHLRLDNTSDNTHIQPTPDTIYHLGRGIHKDKALDHLVRLRQSLLDGNTATSTEDQQVKKAIIADGVKSYMKAITLSQDVNWTETIEKAASSLQAEQSEITAIAIAEAAANGHDNWAFNKIDDMIARGDSGLEELLGEAIISSARLGRADIIFKLCERARQAKVEKNRRYMKLLSCAAGAALVHEHFALAKVIMVMVPEFDALPKDLNELNAWPANKVVRMLRIIRDHKIFTDIALHSGASRNTNSPAWIAALKAEYGLREMSDAGFSTIIHHPEILHILLNYRIPGSGNPKQPAFDRQLVELIMTQYSDNTLSRKDVETFLNVFSNARARLKSSESGSISFFRLRHLTDAPNKSRASPDAVQRSLEIKRDILTVLREYMNHMHLRKTKEPVAELYKGLTDAVSAGMIVKLLQKHLQGTNDKLYDKCMNIIKDYQAEKVNKQEPNKMN